MKHFSIIGAAAGLLVAAVGTAGGAAAQEAKTPPSWDTLVHCAEMTDSAKELACYRAAMKEAGYAPSPKAVAEKRRTFGIALPSLAAKKPSEPAKPKAVAQAGQGASTSAAPAAPAPAEESGADENQITVELAEVAFVPPDNRLLLVTKDGAVWEQQDHEPVAPRPKPGGTIQIERNRFGGFFCRFDKFTKVRCTQIH
jgi:hypothetical protein